MTFHWKNVSLIFPTLALSNLRIHVDEYQIDWDISIEFYIKLILKKLVRTFEIETKLLVVSDLVVK